MDDRDPHYFDWDAYLKEKAEKKLAAQAKAFWNPIRIAALTKMWKNDVLARDIGAALGCSKNAVIGKANRLGLPSRNHADFSPRLRGAGGLYRKAA